MPKITALIHARNDEARLGRALESLRPCDEVIVIDHHSSDQTARVAREHGASVKIGMPGVQAGTYAMDAAHDWILCLQPNEALTEGLEASLFEWKDAAEPAEDTIGYRVALRTEENGDWRSQGTQLRLVNRSRLNWPDELPPPDNQNAQEMAGDVLRFERP